MADSNLFNSIVTTAITSFVSIIITKIFSKKDFADFLRSSFTTKKRAKTFDECFVAVAKFTVLACALYFISRFFYVILHKDDKITRNFLFHITTMPFIWMSPLLCYAFTRRPLAGFACAFATQLFENAFRLKN